MLGHREGFALHLVLGMSRIKVYENIVIGGYLFDLGVQMAKRRPDLPLVSVNLLQQTPADQTLGDLLLANAGVCRIIEFKRAGKLTEKERKKLTALRNGVAAHKYPEDVAEISRWLHWYVEIQEPEMLGEPVVSLACPYLDVASDPEYLAVNEFSAEVADEACDQELSESQRNNISGYVRWVCKLFGEIEAEDRETKSAGGRKVTTSTAFLIALNETGGVSGLVAPSIEYRLMQKKELAEALRLGIEPDPPKYDRGIKPDPPNYEKKIGEGFGFSM